MLITRYIDCITCAKTVLARLTNGAEVYPLQRFMAWVPFWRCDGCGGWVGCQHDQDEPTRPVSSISKPEKENA